MTCISCKEIELVLIDLRQSNDVEAWLLIFCRYFRKRCVSLFDVFLYFSYFEVNWNWKFSCLLTETIKIKHLGLIQLS